MVSPSPRPSLRKERIVVATIERDELKQKIDQGDHRFVLVETLPEYTYQQGHLPGAVNLPPMKVREQAPTVLPDRNADIVVYCGSPT
jgi:rhodanese-related sulfurtransferase